MLLICLNPGSRLSSRSSKSTSPRPAFRSGGWSLGHNLGSHQRLRLFSQPFAKTNPRWIRQNCGAQFQVLLRNMVQGSFSLWEPTRNKTDLCQSWTHQSVGNILETGSNTLCRTHTHTATIVPDGHCVTIVTLAVGNRIELNSLLLLYKNNNS